MHPPPLTFECDSTVSEFQGGKTVGEVREGLTERLHALVVKAIVGEVKMRETGLGVGLYSSKQPGCNISDIGCWRVRMKEGEREESGRI